MTSSLRMAFPVFDSPARRFLPSQGGWPVSSRVAGEPFDFPAPSELDVRVAPHPAQVFTNAPRETRPLLSVFLARGSADDS